MIIKPLAEAISLPTGSGSASTVSNAGLVWVYVSGTITSGGTTTDSDGVLFVIVDAQGGNVVSSIRLAPNSTTRIEKDPAHFCYVTGASGTVYATKIAFTA